MVRLYVTTLNQYFGNAILREYAEPFYAVEMLGLMGFDSLVA